MEGTEWGIKLVRQIRYVCIPEIESEVDHQGDHILIVKWH